MSLRVGSFIFVNCSHLLLCYMGHNFILYVLYILDQIVPTKQNIAKQVISSIKFLTKTYQHHFCKGQKRTMGAEKKEWPPLHLHPTTLRPRPGACCLRFSHAPTDRFIDGKPPWIPINSRRSRIVQVWVVQKWFQLKFSDFSRFWMVPKVWPACIVARTVTSRYCLCKWTRLSASGSRCPTLLL